MIKHADVPPQTPEAGKKLKMLWLKMKEGNSRRDNSVHCRGIEAVLMSSKKEHHLGTSLVI